MDDRRRFPWSLDDVLNVVRKIESQPLRPDDGWAWRQIQDRLDRVRKERQP